MADHVVNVPPGQLGPTLRALGKAFPGLIRAGTVLAAERARTFLVRKSPVYMGQLKNAWTRRNRPDGAEVVNDAPHAGIIERGARPHRVSKEGVEAIREWVRIKLGPELKAGLHQDARDKRAAARGFRKMEVDGEIDRVTNAIVWKLRMKGQKGNFLVQNNLERFSTWLQYEVERMLRLYVHKIGPGGGAPAPAGGAA